MTKFSFLMLLSMLIVLCACGQTGGKAVGSGGGASPFPKVKADCANRSCI